MKWHRVKPGQYALMTDDGELRGIIERSSMQLWHWWWSTWSETFDASGTAATHIRAKELVAFARMANDTARRMGVVR